MGAPGAIILPSLHILPVVTVRYSERYSVIGTTDTYSSTVMKLPPVISTLLENSCSTMVLVTRTTSGYNDEVLHLLHAPLVIVISVKCLQNTGLS